MHLITVLVMIVLSSFTLAILTGMLGHRFSQDGSWRMALGLALFGLAYACLSSLSSPQRTVFLGIGFVLYSCAFSALAAAMHRFYRLPLNGRWLLLGPLCAAMLYIALLANHDLRTQYIYTLLAAQNLWIARLMLRNGIRRMGRGEWVYLLGVAIMTFGLLLRVAKPQSSLAALAAGSDATAVLVPFVGFFIALHCKAVGFVMMAHTRVQSQLQHIADEDCLTGLPNRRCVMHALQQCYDNARQQGSHLAVLLMDIDHFKRVNDQCGHPTGDALLTALGQILRQHLRQQSVAGRYGGEEFMVVCPHTSAEEALQLARRLCDAVRENLRITHAKESWPVTISVGISNFVSPHAGINDSGQSLIQQADQALYKAKNAGRDQVQVFGADLSAPEPDNSVSLSGLVA